MLPSRPFVFAAGLILAGGAGLAAEEPQASPLEPGRPIERELKAGETHGYHVSLVSGQCLTAELDRRGIKLAADVIDPQGHRILRVVSPLWNFGLQRIFVIAKETGTYRLSVSAFRPVTPSGRYRIGVASIQATSPSDRLRSAALQKLSEGAGLAIEPDAQARERGLARYDEAIALWRKAGDRAGEALSLFASGELRRERSEYVLAFERYGQSLALAKATGDRWLQGKNLSRIGNISVFAKPADALEALKESLSIARSVGDAELEAETLNSTAWAYWSLSRYQQTLDYAMEALAVCRAAKHRWEEAWAWWELGFAYWALGEPERSLRANNESLRLWRELDETSRQANSLISIGLVYTQIGANPKALETFQKALAVMRAVGNRGAEAFALHDLGYVQFAMGDLESAQASLEQALRVCREVQDRFTEPYAHYSLGLVYEARGDPELASRSLDQALRLAQALEFRDLQAMTLTAMARLDAARGDLHQARERIGTAIGISESLRGALAGESARATYLSTRQDAYKIQTDILLALHASDPGRGYDAMAFEASERGRARSLLDAVSEARLDLAGDLPEDLRKREKELSDELVGLQVELYRATSNRAAAERRLAEAEERWESLLVEIRRSSPRYASLRHPNPLSLIEVRERLDGATALVSYSVDPKNVLVFVVTRGGLGVERLPVTPSQLLEQVENCVGLLSRGESASSSGLADRLYAELVQPWRQRLPEGVRRLIILPDGVLHSLPFEALRGPGERPRRLLDDFAISYAPSATVLSRLELRKEAGSGEPPSLFVIGDPTVPEFVRRRAVVADEAFDISPLPYAAVEAKDVFRFGGPQSQLLLGPDASERRTKETSLESFGVLHFATHGFLSRRFPARSSLLLSPEGRHEGFLTAREIYRLKLRSELVVLSSCQTARGRILAGEGVQGLAQAFFHAGARSVVASLWDVSDRRTADLMGAFYRHMARGEPKSEALQSAKRDLLARDPRLAPRYWAPFVLLGDSRGVIPLREPRAVPGWTLISAAAVVIAAAVAFARRRRLNGAA